MGLIGKFEKGKNLERTIEEMEVGESAYTFPDVLYLDIEAPIHKKKCCDSCMPVKRTGPERDAYEVDIRNVCHTWGVSLDIIDEDGDICHPAIVRLEYQDCPTEMHEMHNPPTLGDLKRELGNAIKKEYYHLAADLKRKIQRAEDALRDDGASDSPKEPQA